MIKEFFAKKSIGFYLTAVSVLFTLIGIISYSVAGTDSFGLEPAVIVMLVLAVVAGLVSMWKDFGGWGPIAVSIFLGIAVGVFLNDRFIYYSHLYYGIASHGITTAMVLTTVFFILMLVSGITSAFFKSEKEV